MDISKRILVVDDDERVLFVFRGALVRLGSDYEIVTAQNGCEALERAREASFDLVITDLRMPDMDGIALTEAIRAMDSGVVVIWVTAYGCHKLKADAARLAVYGCLDKPVEINEIRETARKALEVVQG
jgi:DNA-binding NtrC family response regulator